MENKHKLPSAEQVSTMNETLAQLAHNVAMANDIKKASDSATAAAQSATNAKTSETTATDKATEATTQAGKAKTSAEIATSQATIATTKAVEASTSAGEAKIQATIATTKAGEASTSANAASASAETSKTQAQESARQAGIATQKAKDATDQADRAKAQADEATRQAGIATNSNDFLNERINNLVANTGDSNTEIVDARVGFDNTTYKTLGEAIRTQVGNVDNKALIFRGLAQSGGDITDSSIYSPGTYVCHKDSHPTGLPPEADEYDGFIIVFTRFTHAQAYLWISNEEMQYRYSSDNIWHKVITTETLNKQIKDTNTDVMMYRGLAQSGGDITDSSIYPPGTYVYHVDSHPTGLPAIADKYNGYVTIFTKSNNFKAMLLYTNNYIYFRTSSENKWVEIVNEDNTKEYIRKDKNIINLKEKLYTDNKDGGGFVLGNRAPKTYAALLESTNRAVSDVYMAHANDTIVITGLPNGYKCAACGMTDDTSISFGGVDGQWDSGWITSYTYYSYVIPHDTYAGIVRIAKSDGTSDINIDDLKNTKFQIIDTHSRISKLETGIGNEDCFSLKDSFHSIGHAGCGYAPENTQPAFIEAYKRGFNIVETDVNFAKNNVPVLIHDNTIDRTSNGTGNVADMTLEELKTYDFGSKFDEKYAGTKIMSLEEFVILLKRLNMYAQIEIKDQNMTNEQAKVVYDIIKKYHMASHVTFISFYVEPLLKISALNKSFRCGINYMWGSGGVDVVKNIRDIYGYNYFSSYKYEVLTDEVLNKCKENNIELEAWTIDNEDTIKNLDPYISGVTSNTIVASEVFKKEYIS